MTSIKYILDAEGNQVFPVTHEKAVRDGSGTTLESKLQDIESDIADVIGEDVDVTYTSSSSYYTQGTIYPTSSVSVGSTATPEASTEANGCYVIPCKKGYSFEFRTRHDNGKRWMVVDRSFTILQMEDSVGLTTDVKTFDVTSDNAAYAIINQAGYGDYNHAWTYVDVTAEISGDINDLREGLKFKTILYNLVDGDLSGDTFSVSGTYTKSGGEIIITASTSSNVVYQILRDIASIGDIIYCSAWVKSSVSGTDRVAFSVGNNVEKHSGFHSGSNEYELLSTTGKIESNTNIQARVLQNNSSGFSDREVRIKNVTFLNLTELFGKGNEPSIAEMDAMLSKYENTVIPVSGMSVSSFDSNKVFDLNHRFYNISSFDVINPYMDKSEIVSALNTAFVSYAALCKVDTACFYYIRETDGISETYEKINRNFRRDVVSLDMNASEFCKAVNEALKSPALRFCDAKINTGASRDFSLSTGLSSDEPSVICSEDGGTMYIYAHLKRISTTDGVNWSDPIDTPLSQGYIMHINVAFIDGVYYMTGTQGNGYGLLLYTSSDGINFEYKGVIFEASHSTPNETVINFGNTSLIKEYGSGKFYLYYEHTSEDHTWHISLATCTDILLDNNDGSVGNWIDYQNNPIIDQHLYYNLKNGGSGYYIGVCNPDFAKLCDNRPLKYNGYYYIYFHGTCHSQSLIYRMKSQDLVNWEEDGFCFDNRDEPTNGDNTSGNADHCLIGFKGRTYFFYTWDINYPGATTYIKYTIDDRPFEKILSLRP